MRRRARSVATRGHVVQCLPGPGGMALAATASSAQPAQPAAMGSDGPSRHSVAPRRTHLASLPRSALRCQYPRQEPSALVALAGIRAGGRPKGRSLPRSWATVLYLGVSPA